MLLSNARGTLTRTIDAASETISLTEIKEHLRIDEVADHDVLLLLITAVRKAVEELLERTLVESTWTLDLDMFFPNCIELPMGPIQSIATVNYYDDDNALQTLATSEYEFDRNGRLRPQTTKTWPSTYDRLNAVTITYVAGEVHAGDVPDDIKQAMKLLIGQYEQHRENTIVGTIIATVPDSFKFLTNHHRVHRI